MIEASILIWRLGNARRGFLTAQGVARRDLLERLEKYLTVKRKWLLKSWLKDFEGRRSGCAAHRSDEDESKDGRRENGKWVEEIEGWWL